MSHFSDSDTHFSQKTADRLRFHNSLVSGPTFQEYAKNDRSRPRARSKYFPLSSCPHMPHTYFPGSDILPNTSVLLELIAHQIQFSCIAYNSSLPSRFISYDLNVFSWLVFCLFASGVGKRFQRRRSSAPSVEREGWHHR